MANIYTKTGDKGTTSLVGGERVSKADIRLEAYGTADELNSFIGLLRAKPLPEGMDDVLRRVQNKLFNLGGFLATDRTTTPVYESCEVKEEEVRYLEQQIDAIQNELPPVHAFILPGGDETIALCHVCRTVCRRLERRMVSLFGDDAMRDEKDQICLQYVNRLSDFLFILSKKCAKNNKKELFLWEK